MEWLRYEQYVLFLSTMINRPCSRRILAAISSMTFLLTCVASCGRSGASAPTASIKPSSIGIFVLTAEQRRELARLQKQVAYPIRLPNFLPSDARLVSVKLLQSPPGQPTAVSRMRTPTQLFYVGKGWGLFIQEAVSQGYLACANLTKVRGLDLQVTRPNRYGVAGVMWDDPNGMSFFVMGIRLPVATLIRITESLSRPLEDRKRNPAWIQHGGAKMIVGKQQC
jgi:hypothetical protein